MPLAQSLQRPKIIQILNSTIRIAHPDISRNLRTYLNAPLAAAGTVVTVRDNDGIADDDFLLFGEIGDKQTEATDVTTANVAGTGLIARGTSFAVTAVVFAHEVDAPITMLNERRIRIFRAASDGGAGTLIASIDALTNDAINIQWDRPYTEYTLRSGDTTGATHYYVTFDDGTVQSAASDYVAVAGHGATVVENLVQQALDLTDTVIDNRKITREMCVRWADNCQDAIAQFVYQDPATGQYVKKDWSWEVVENITSLDVATNDNTYAMSGLTRALKYPDSERSFINIRLGDKSPLDYVDPDEMDRLLANKPYTTTTVATVAADTTLTVADTAEFGDSGSLYISSRQLTYTAKAATTFTGIPAAGTGSIDAVYASGSIVWQGISPDLPKKYTLFDGVLILDKPPHSDYNTFAIKVRYYAALARLTEASDTTTIPFVNVFQYYIGSMMQRRRGNYDEADKLMAIFEKKVLANAVADKTPSADEHTYYDFDTFDNPYL